MHYHCQWYRVPARLGRDVDGELIPGPLLRGLQVIAEIVPLAMGVTLAAALLRLSSSWSAHALAVGCVELVRNVLPAMAGQFIVSIKDSSLVSLISIRELTLMGSKVSSSTQRFFELWLLTATLYFAECFTCAMLFRALERRWKLRT
jgi:ABC-type amino acid transport system permease subunit